MIGSLSEVKGEKRKMGNKRERNENVLGLREREALTFDNPALRWNVKYTCVRKQRKRWASELYNEDEKEACRVRVQLRLVVEITTTCMYTIRPTPCGVCLQQQYNAGVVPTACVGASHKESATLSS